MAAEKELSISCPPGARLDVRDGYAFLTHPDHPPRKIPIMELLLEAVKFGDDVDLFKLGTEINDS
jgi:hypothetical protein